MYHLGLGRVVAVLYATDTRIIKSTDHGDTWTTLVGSIDSRSLDVRGNRLWFTHISNTLDNLGYCGLDGSGVTYISGTVWTAGGAGVDSILNGYDDNLVLVAVVPGLSADAGFWKFTTGGGIDITPAAYQGQAGRAYWGVVPVTDQIYVGLIITDGSSVSGVDRIVRTTDGGANWTVVHTFPTGLGPGRFGVEDYDHIVVLSSNRQTLACNGTVSVFPGTGMTILISQDGGATWVEEDMSSHSAVTISGPGGMAVP